jgi:hypothetical protein
MRRISNSTDENADGLAMLLEHIADETPQLQLRLNKFYRWFIMFHRQFILPSSVLP